MISRDEYIEIKEFLKEHVCYINSSENSYRNREREKESEFSYPDVNSFGWMPAIDLCYSRDVGNNQILYILPFLSFHTFLTKILPHAVRSHQTMFGTGDARDVLSALYNVSGYQSFGDINEYERLLRDDNCCYFLLKGADGKLIEKLLRIDLFRHILPSEEQPDKYDFIGGLMHTFKHCSWRGMRLSYGNGEIELNSPWELPILLGEAILCDSENKKMILFEGERDSWKIMYHIDPETGIYYLTTAFVKHNGKWI